MYSIDTFINIIKSKAPVNGKVICGYVLGAQGQIMTKEIIEQLIKWTGGDRSKYYFNGYSAEDWIGYQCFDCSGLIIWTLQQMDILKPNEDYTAHNIYVHLCIPINKSELKAGDLCFVKDGNKITHVGVYIGNGQVVHARGTKYGVVTTEILPYFNVFGRLKYFVSEVGDMLEVFTTKKVVTATKLNVRERPNSNSGTKILGQLDNGNVVEVTGKANDKWYRIIYNGKDAYVHGDYLKDYEEIDYKKKCEELLAENVKLQGKINMISDIIKGS